MVLRQQLLVLNRKSPKRVRLRNLDRLIFVWLCRLFPSMWDVVVIIKPETVLRWHRRGFAPTGAGSLGGMEGGPGSITNSGPTPECQPREKKHPLQSRRGSSDERDGKDFQARLDFGENQCRVERRANPWGPHA